MAKRPQQPERVPVKMRGALKVREDRSDPVLKHAPRIAGNEKLDACCRDVGESTVEFFDTDGNGVPDLMIVTCNECAKRQIVQAMGGRGTDGRLPGVSV